MQPAATDGGSCVEANPSLLILIDIFLANSIYFLSIFNFFANLSIKSDD